MAGRMEGRVALLTGATGGIGAATARLFAREGARLVLTDLDQEAVARLAGEIDPEGARAVGVTLDVSSAEQWARAVELARERFGALDALVNIAGILSWAGIEATEQADWDRVVAVNQTGTWLGMKASMGLLKASGHGSIINTSSILGLIGAAARPPTRRPRAPCGS